MRAADDEPHCTSCEHVTKPLKWARSPISAATHARAHTIETLSLSLSARLLSLRRPERGREREKPTSSIVRTLSYPRHAFAHTVPNGLPAPLIAQCLFVATSDSALRITAVTAAKPAPAAHNPRRQANASPPLPARRADAAAARPTHEAHPRPLARCTAVSVGNRPPAAQRHRLEALTIGQACRRTRAARSPGPAPPHAPAWVVHNGFFQGLQPMVSAGSGRKLWGREGGDAAWRG
eukprot:359699-Chlamydomonas_euryale.AAC.4